MPCLSDNYAYLLVDEATNEAAAVDPVEPEKVLAVAKSENLKISMVLTTHHHWDHAGGNSKIKSLVSNLSIVGGLLDPIEGKTKNIEEGETFFVGKNIIVKAIHTPCHTRGHMSYYATGVEGGEAPVVFTGDTLFVAGCGRFFEGSPEEMFDSLCKKLGTLPPDTKVYCGHEYTVKNLEFALTVEPKNEILKQKLVWARDVRNRQLATVPSTITEELQTNPFMRVELPSLQEATGKKSPIEVMAEIRRRKDKF